MTLKEFNTFLKEGTTNEKDIDLLVEKILKMLKTND